MNFSSHYLPSIGPLLLSGFVALSTLPACAVFDAMGGEDDEDTRSEVIDEDILSDDTRSDDIVEEPDASISKCPTTCGAGACNEGGQCVFPVAISTGHNHVCALFDDDSIRCWGDNSSGQLGRPLSEEASSTPKKVDFGDTSLKPTQVSAGGEHTCAILKDATQEQEAVYCWGQNSHKQLGNTEAAEANPTPVQVELDGGLDPHHFYRVEAGARHSCLVTNEPRLVSCWGDDSNSQSGNSNGTNPILKPTHWVVDFSIDANGTTLKGVERITSQANHVCILNDSNALKCWGANQKRQLGVETSAPHQQPFATPPDWPHAFETTLKATAVTTGFSHTCALLEPASFVETGRELYCWGTNQYGQSDPSALTKDDLATPTRILPASTKRSTHIAAGATFTCVTQGINANIRCFGSADKGQIGETSPTGDLTVGQRGEHIESRSGISIDHVEGLDAGASHTCALRSNTAGQNEVWCWGDNTSGQLGVELSASEDDCSDAESCSKTAFRVDFSR